MDTKAWSDEKNFYIQNGVVPCITGPGDNDVNYYRVSSDAQMDQVITIPLFQAGQNNEFSASAMASPLAAAQAAVALLHARAWMVDPSDLNKEDFAR